MPFIKYIPEPVFVSQGLPKTVTTAAIKPSTSSSTASTNGDSSCNGTNGSIGESEDDQVIYTVISADTTEFEYWANGTLCNVLRQLASVAKISHKIFSELETEIKSISDRQLKLHERVTQLDQRANKLNAKKVKIRKSIITKEPCFDVMSFKSATACLINTLIHG